MGFVDFLRMLLGWKSRRVPAADDAPIYITNAAFQTKQSSRVAFSTTVSDQIVFATKQSSRPDFGEI